MKMHGGYVGKILRVDLSSEGVKELSTEDYVPDYIGGIGLGYRLLWAETNENTTEWSPENTLIFASGPLCGTPSPGSGRSEVIGFAPQGYPKPWAAPSGFGGDFGPKLKFAGYDALIVLGKSESPKYLYVSEDGISLLDGKFLWGMDTFTAQEALFAKHGYDIAIACIGPAGENRVRWATIQSKTKNAAGQGGLGAVMGDKKLKAIVFKPWSHKVPIANPEKLIEEVVRISRELSPAGQNRAPLFSEYEHYTTRRQSCSYAACTGGPHRCFPIPQGCTSQPIYYGNVPMKYTGEGTVSGALYCESNCVYMMLDYDPSNIERSFEIAKFLDKLGLNHYEAFFGMNWFIQNCYNAGKLSKVMGENIKLNPNGPKVYPKQDVHTGMTPEFAVKFVKAVAYREGEGDIWAEGTPRAAEILGLSDEVYKTHKHGYGPHWDGRHMNRHEHFPVWIVTAVSWATQGKDPMGQQHGYGMYYPTFVKEWNVEKTGKNMFSTDLIPYADICEVGAKIYGAKYANEGWDKPELGYLDKEHVAIWHDHRAIIKSSATVCDSLFPLLYDPDKPDKIGDIDAEVRLFNAVVGTDWSLDDMHQAAERVFNVMRAIHVRQGRTRAHDESIIPYYQQPAMFPDEPQTIDVNQFRALLERFYEVRGWDKTTALPTRGKLESLGLKEIADELEKLGKL